MDDTSQVLDVIAPFSGIRVPLERVPDPVFAQRLVGDGASMDPISAQLRAPVSGHVVQLHRAGHALSLRTDQGIEILVHIGIDTVQLGGDGFQARVAEGDQVQVGQVLIDIDLDHLARRARSLLTQVVVANMDSVERLELGRGELVAGNSVLFRVFPRSSAERPVIAPTGETLCSEPIILPNPTGLHARPAALLAERARTFHAEVKLRLGERRGNAKSVVSILGLNTRHGDSLQVEARGADAAEAVASLAQLLASGCGDDAEAGTAHGAQASIASALATPEQRAAGELFGVTASPGIAVGRVAHWQRQRIEVPKQGEGVALERPRLQQALSAAKHDLARLQASLADPVRSGILEAHIALLDDPELVDAALSGISAGQSAGFAWQQAFETHAAGLAALDNPVLRERAPDLRDAGQRVLASLAGSDVSKIVLPAGSILIAEDLSPSDTAQLDRNCVLGLCTTGGGATSHVAILARAMGIPALCGIEAAALQLPEGRQVILDAERGRLQTRPDAAAVTAAGHRMQAAARQHEHEQAGAMQAAHTRDGKRIEVVANVRHADDAREAIAAGAEGVGLLRSEFLFEDRSSAPDQAEQAAAYADVAAAVGEQRTLVIRTLDVGGDKPLPYLPLPAEDNPFLGLRGIRVSLAHPELFRTQLRALLSISTMTKLHVMLPMVATLAELRAARQIVAEEAKALGVAMPPLGIMIEVPAAALLAEHFAREADFFSIGSNDLTQYTLAMDRGHPRLAAQADALDPAVLRLIGMSCEAAQRHGRWVGVCGALASDALAAPLLIGLGVTELSVSTPSVAAVKAVLRRCDSEQCRQLAREVLSLESAAAVRAWLAQFAAQLNAAELISEQGTMAC